MTFSEITKNEILNKKDKQPCCLVASLSAFIRSAGSLNVHNGMVGFEVVSENESAIRYYAEIIENIYGEKPVVEISSKHKKHKLFLISLKSTNLLIDLDILSADKNGITVNFNLNNYLIENECCERAYVAGAFIGNGSVTVPKNEKNSRTNYHLEFVFSKYQTALDFSNILSKNGFLPKYIERKETHVVYFKNGDEISELLFYMGATKACFELKNIVITKDIRNETNRRINCEMANIDKQLLAGENQVKSIQIIIDTIGLDKLPLNLKSIALLRLKNPGSSLEELSKMSGLTKSCLNHRLRKITEIANNL